LVSTNFHIWTVLPVVLPLIAGLFCFAIGRYGFLICLTVSLCNIWIILKLLFNFLVSGPEQYLIGGWRPPLGIVLRVDAASLLMLCMTSVTAIGITCYSAGYFSFRIATPVKPGRHERQSQFFWPLWMMLLGGLNGLFMSGDIFNIYVTLEVVGLSAVALAALSGKPASQIAAFRYLLVNLLGSLSYLLGISLLYKSYSVLDLQLLKQVIPQPGVSMPIVLITVGLLLKTALFPMHFWLPPAHANALAPVSVILSALIVKASFYLIFRFWFDIFPQFITPAAENFLGLLGAGAIIWGAIQALRQQRLKMLIAYSTISQIGYLFVAFPLTRFKGEHEFWLPIVFMALGHAWAKAAMFMSAGAVFLHAGHDRIYELSGVRSYLPVTVFAYAIAGVNMMGLPPSGGFIAKWVLISSAIEVNQWWWGLIIMAGSLLASAYVFKVVSRFFVVLPNIKPGERFPHSAFLEWPALILALLSLILGIFAPYIEHIFRITQALPMLSTGGT